MLSELRVKNFALIKDLRVQFHSGLNVITGETGAGKSLLLKSLQLLMGGKAPSDLVGNFGDETLVEGLFSVSKRPDLQENLKRLSYWNDEDHLLVRRLICKKGKSRTYINGSLATVTDLRQLIAPLVELTAKAEPLIELTNQHDNKNLQNPSYQRDLFDTYAKNFELRAQLSKLYSELNEKKSELKEINKSDSDRLQKIDFLNFQLKELDDFSPQEGEYEALKSERKKRSKSEKLKEVIYNGEESLSNTDNSVLSQLYSLSAQLQKLGEAFPETVVVYNFLEGASDKVEKALDLLKQLERTLSDEEDLSFKEIEERLKTYEHLFRKYSATAEELDKIYQSLNQQRNDLESIDETRTFMEKEIQSILSSITPLAESLSLSRKKNQKPFEDAVNKSLQELNMKDLRLKIKNEDVELCEYGREEISFWLSFAKGDQQERSIKKAASGGELSRILLAVKGSLENLEAPRTYLFDEIDAGVSGPTAEKVGKKLKALAEGQQVITITHLPQVAALGEHHFLIEKSSGKSGEQTQLKNLSDQERIAEVARLISGEEITQSSLDHASRLVELR